MSSNKRSSPSEEIRVELESIEREIELWKMTSDPNTYRIAVDKAMKLTAFLVKTTPDHPALQVFRSYYRFQIGGSKVVRPISIPISLDVLKPAAGITAGAPRLDYTKGDAKALLRYRHLIVTKDDPTVLLPRKLPKQLDARARVFGDEIFSMKSLEYTSREGMILSNILLSQFTDIIKTSNKQIDYDIYTTVAQPIPLANPEVPSVIKLDDRTINHHTCAKVILGWLKVSGFYSIGRHYRELGDSAKNVVLTRRCLLTPISFLVAGGGSSDYEGHEIAIFWEYNHREGRYNFYIVDNLSIDSYAYPSSRNVFKEAIIHCVSSSLHNAGFPPSPEFVDIIDIHNRSVMMAEGDLFKVEGYKGINYLCTSAARRAALYAASIVNLRDNEVWNEQDSTEAFFGHFNHFIHQMHRMINWCMHSPAVWPKSKTDAHNTILPPPPFVTKRGMNMLEHILNREEATGRDVTAELVVKLEPSLSYLLLKPIDREGFPAARGGEPQPYYFRLDGAEAFSPEQPLSEHLKETCRVSRFFKTY